MPFQVGAQLRNRIQARRLFDTARTPAATRLHAGGDGFKRCGDGLLISCAANTSCRPAEYRGSCPSADTGCRYNPPRLRPIHKEPRPGPLAQRIIHILGIVREHPKGAIAPHDRVGPCKALHQHGGNLQLPRAGLPVPAFARQLVNVVNRAKADHDGIKILLINALAFCPDLP